MQKNFRPGKWNPRTSSDRYKRAQLRKFVEKKARRNKAEYRAVILEPAKRLAGKLMEIAHSQDSPENKLLRALIAGVQRTHPEFSYLEAMDYLIEKYGQRKEGA